MFMDPTSPGLMWTLLGIGGVIAIVILINSGDAMGSNIAPWFEQNYAWVIGAIIIVIIFFVIVSSGRPPRPRPPAHHSLGFG